MVDSSTPGQRLMQRVAVELAQLVRELDEASHGKDAAVHRARKCLQRLRSLLRLARDVDPEWFARCDGALKRLRRRLGVLRDAAVRVELVTALRDDEVVDDRRPRLDAALQRLEAQRDAAWAGLPEGFWPRLQAELARHAAESAAWPLADVTAEHVVGGLERERRRLRRALRESLGRTHRNLRHELRRHLRRYGAMRKSASQLLRRRDPAANRIIDLARALGAEGDLWLTITALQRVGDRAASGPLRSELERRRRALCRLHDGELVALRRNLLAKKTEFAAPRAARPGAPAKRAGSAGSAGSAAIGMTGAELQIGA